MPPTTRSSTSSTNAPAADKTPSDNAGQEKAKPLATPTFSGMPAEILVKIADEVLGDSYATCDYWQAQLILEPRVGFEMTRTAYNSMVAWSLICRASHDVYKDRSALCVEHANVPGEAPLWWVVKTQWDMCRLDAALVDKIKPMRSFEDGEEFL